MRTKLLNCIHVLMLLALLSGCVGGRTFHELARAGDTVIVAAGLKRHYDRKTMTVTITPSSGPAIVYGPNHPAVRAVIRLYPDPASSLVVSPETDQDLTPYARSYASLVKSSFAGGDRDWWQTTVFIDLPASLPVGTATINIATPQDEQTSSTVEIVSGTGKSNDFYATFGPLSEDQIASMERVSHYVVTFSGSNIPYAIQLDLVHDPDVDNGGVGRAYVINPRGDIKTVTWKDDGTSLRVILLPARNRTPDNLLDYKFYVAGGITGLAVSAMKVVDINGQPVSGLSASITPSSF